MTGGTRRATLQMAPPSRIDPFGRAVASCWGCGERLAIAARAGASQANSLHGELVPRPEPHGPSGLPRYGPPSRAGRVRHHATRRLVTEVTGDVETLIVEAEMQPTGLFELYVNCPRCDRGQTVELPRLDRAVRPWTVASG